MFNQKILNDHISSRVISVVVCLIYYAIIGVGYVVYDESLTKALRGHAVPVQLYFILASYFPVFAVFQCWKNRSETLLAFVNSVVLAVLIYKITPGDGLEMLLPIVHIVAAYVITESCDIHKRMLKSGCSQNEYDGYQFDLAILQSDQTFRISLAVELTLITVLVIVYFQVVSDYRWLFLSFILGSVYFISDSIDLNIESKRRLRSQKQLSY